MTPARKKILFLHGFYAGGLCIPAQTLREMMADRAEVLSPDLPTHPQRALELIRDLCDREKPDLLVGNSCGAFYAQMLAPVIGVPALLGNPHFGMSAFLQERIGVHEYHSPRYDGNKQFVIDEAIVQAFAELESVQFRYCNPYYSDRVWGLFGEQDTLAHYEPTFLEHYTRSFHFPGHHTPTADEIRTWYVPLAEQMLTAFPLPADGVRYFRHFKGGQYRFVRTAFDSETKERMVVYQALYGERQYWVRPEKMFFESVTRDGHTFPRFTEVEKI
ncbi:MAG: alpha/beta fold hydrolase [Paludibacteraceae bacterium]|nr:alpha/beta fold hydrolase [Paludibacteraceae bacterium]